MRTKITILLLLISCTYAEAHREFARTYQSNTLPKGVNELETWATWRSGREYLYNRLDTRIELESGLTDRLQTALYFNASHKSYGASLDTLGGIADTSSSGIFSESEFSVSSEWKLNLMNASTAPFGFAVYAELGFSPSEIEIENKLIFDKRTAKSTWALNLVSEFELKYDVKKGKTVREWESKPEIDLAYMYMFKPTFGLGIEIRNSNEIEEGNWNFSALYGGPTLFFSNDKHFIIFNILPQWANLHKTDDAPNNLVLNAREKVETRLIWGISL